MNWLECQIKHIPHIMTKDMYSTLRRADGAAEEIGTTVGGVGGMAAGAAIGSIFGPMGTMVGMYLGAKAGAEGVQMGIKEIKHLINRL
ncbi:MAG: hypothetical protein LBS62_04175 [Clostridiales bacterium]|jgi:hypothetical protein|nr:hypothetical protein [Clostridiales bacterium]